MYAMGQTDWNLEGRLQGSSDIELNNTGISQAEQAASLLRNEPIGTICCSPLMRARKTADIINQQLNRPIVEIADLRECDFGANEGSVGNDWLHNWLAGDTEGTPDDVEHISEFSARVLNAVETALGHVGPVLIVAHGGTYSPLNQMLARDEQWSLPNCIPVRHLPPTGAATNWKKQIIS